MMKMYKKTILIAIFIMMQFLICACGQKDNLPTSPSTLLPTTEKPILSQTQRPNEGALHSAELVGKGYADPSLKMIVYLMHPDWTYYKDRELGQVYFFNEMEKRSNNLISMSAFEFQGDTEIEAEKLWSWMKSDLDSQNLEIDYMDRRVLDINGKYIGYQYPYEIKLNEDVFYGSASFWGTEEMMYTCTATADEEHKGEIRIVLEGIIESFMSQ